MGQSPKPRGTIREKPAIQHQPRPIRVGTRASKLALTQSQWVADQLAAAHPGLACQLVHITTSGDRQTTQPLPQIGGKGLFTRELEEALLRGDIDLAVHSLKDLPTQLPIGLVVASVPVRAPANDALIVASGQWTVDSGQRADDRGQTTEDRGQKTDGRRQTADGGAQKAGGAARFSLPSAIWHLPSDEPASRVPRPEDPLAQLPSGARVGTSSPRRAAQLRLARPDLVCLPIRGNLDTRLRKLAEGQADALVLALAGLVRLGLVSPSTERGTKASRVSPATGSNPPPTPSLRGRGVGPLSLEGRGQGEAEGRGHGRASPKSAATLPSILAEHGNFALEVLPFEVMLPAPGQGALAIQASAGSEAEGLAAAIADPAATAATAAERALLDALGGGCSMPLGAYAELLGDTLRLRAILFSPDGSAVARADLTGSATDPAALARAVAQALRSCA